MQYMLKDFELFPDKKDGALFYSPETSAHISNENVVKILQEIKNIRELTDAGLNKLTEKYNLHNTTIKDFLMRELKIISPLDEQRFDKLFISSDDAEINDVLHEYFNAWQGMKIYSRLDFSLVTENSLIVVFNSTYRAESFNELYQLAKKHKAWIISSYLANNYLVIDNIFNTDKGMPCHFCNYNRHQNLVMSKNALKKTSWINFCRRAMAEDIHVLPAMRLTAVERGLSAFWLAKTLKNYLTSHGVSMFMQDVGSYSWINLVTGEMNQEQAVHWAFCPCLSEEIKQ